MRKLICKLFGHKYRSGQGIYKHIKDDVFRVTQCCVFCGEKTCCRVHIPLPEPPKEDNNG